MCITSQWRVLLTQNVWLASIYFQLVLFFSIKIKNGFTNISVEDKMVSSFEGSGVTITGTFIDVQAV